MKKIIILILFTICLVFGISAFAACNGNVNNVDKRYNENITYKLSYTSAYECPNGNISDDKLHDSLNFEVGKTYYMVMDFKISSFERSDWRESFSSTVKIFPLETISATLEEAATGNMSEKAENGGTIITTTYSIPKNRGEEKTYRVTFQLKIRNEGLINIGFLFYGDNENTEKAYLDEISFGLNVTAGLNYGLNSDGKSYSVFVINGPAKIKDSEIKIPKLYWGLPITFIGTFYYCTSLTSITIPDSVTSIGASAFCDCRSLKSISIGNSVTSIGGNAFYNTAYYNNHNNWTNNVLYLGNYLIAAKDTLSGNYEIRQGTKLIADDAFYGCTSIESVTIPDGVTSIGEGAFSSCTSLKSVNIPNGVTSIGNSAFKGCRITSITIPDSVTSIGNYVFSGCTSLESITIPDSVTEIGNGAFNNCTNLASVTIGNGVTSIGEGAFSSCTSLESIRVSDGNAVYSSQDGILYDKGKTKFIHIPKAIVGPVTVPDSITSIGRGAFKGCRITSITIPDSVTYIGESAFYDCTSLESVTIGNGVTSIGYDAFGGCTSLTSVTFENNAGWKVAGYSDMRNAQDITLDTPAQNAKYLNDTYRGYYWKRY